MKWFMARRLGTSLLTLLLSAIVVFLGVRALPGGPELAMSGQSGDPAVAAQIRREFGLDRPVIEQFWAWFSHAIRLDFGSSPRTGIPVADELAQRLPVTIELALLAVLIGLAIGVPLGILAAVKQGTPWDYLTSATALVGLSVPNFWLGMMLVIVCAVQLQILPASGFVPLPDILGNLQHMLLPSLVLGIGFAAVVMRQMRSAMLESLSADYIRTARAKGMPVRSVLWVHAARNSMTTVVTVVGLQLGALFSGVVVIEQIFVIPGLGKLTIDSVFNRDYPVLQGVVLVAAAGYVVVNLLTDLSYSLLNPRIRVAGGAS